MVGGGNRRDEGSFTVSNTNVFAALETLRKKKKSDKGSSKGSKSSSKTGAGKSKQGEEEKPVFWAPAPLTVKSWADVDDEDDDDYYATTAPPQAMWAGSGSGSNKAEETDKLDHLEESESEDELLDEGDDDAEEEPDHETEVQEHPEPIVNAPVEASPAPKDTERQLSKKERRKKELAELEAILADFGVNPKEKAEDETSGINPKEKAEDETSDVNKDGKEGQVNGVAEKKENGPAESKSAKKKKKKDKASKEVKESQDQPNSSDAPTEQDETAGSEHVEGDTSAVDVKERLKKVASKKKKSGKEVDSAARAVAMEAAARSAKLAAAKKKEKNHYNQQPIR